MTSNIVEIDIRVDAGSWQEVAHLQPKIDRIVDAAITVAKLPVLPNSELSILLTDDRSMKSINAEWRGIEKPTNVLSFPAGDVKVGDAVGPMLGDIILSFETLDREAGQAELAFENHFAHLIVHGFLHLFGYDHETDGEAEQMEALETSILDALGIADPYR